MSTDLNTEVDGDMITTAEALSILKRLAQAFQLVDKTLTGEHSSIIYVVSGIVGESPVVSSFLDRQDLADLILEKRTAQNADTENEHFLHIFYGQQWHLQKGRVWNLWDGKTLEQIEGNLPAFIDVTGSLRMRPDLDDVLPADDDQATEAPPTTETPPAEAPAVQAAPRVVGEEPPAAPYEEPDITD